MPRFSPQFEKLAAQHIGYAVHQTLLFASATELSQPDSTYSYDLSNGTLTIGNRTMPMLPLGTTLPEHKVLAWCYADSSLDNWPWAKKTSWSLRLFGIDHNIPEFTAGGVPIGEWDHLDDAAIRISLVALGLLKAQGNFAYKMHHGGGFYVLVEDPALPVPEEPEPELVEKY